MKKKIIVYQSSHHQNTEKLVLQLARALECDTCPIDQTDRLNLSQYTEVVFAGGVYYGKPAESLTQYIKINAGSLKDKKIHLILTSGVAFKSYILNFKKMVEDLGLKVDKTFHCKGFSSYGILKYIGGVAKGHPNDDDIISAIMWFRD